MDSSKSKYEHMLTLGLPILLAILGGTLALTLKPVRERNLLHLAPLVTYLIVQSIGLALIFMSKLPNLKKKIYFNFGFKGMNRRERFLYVLGYTILIATTAHEIIFAVREGLL